MGNLELANINTRLAGIEDSLAEPLWKRIAKKGLLFILMALGFGSIDLFKRSNLG